MQTPICPNAPTPKPCEPRSGRDGHLPTRRQRDRGLPVDHRQGVATHHRPATPLDRLGHSNALTQRLHRTGHPRRNDATTTTPARDPRRGGGDLGGQPQGASAQTSLVHSEAEPLGVPYAVFVVSIAIGVHGGASGSRERLSA